LNPDLDCQVLAKYCMYILVNIKIILVLTLVRYVKDNSLALETLILV